MSLSTRSRKKVTLAQGEKAKDSNKKEIPKMKKSAIKSDPQPPSLTKKDIQDIVSTTFENQINRLQVDPTICLFTLFVELSYSFHLDFLSFHLHFCFISLSFFFYFILLF